MLEVSYVLSYSTSLLEEFRMVCVGYPVLLLNQDVYITETAYISYSLPAHVTEWNFMPK